MREKTRCEVDDPISTPTESTHSSSSSPNVRPVLEKKIRPPISSVMGSDFSLSFLRQQAAIIALVIFGPHPVFRAFLPHAFGIFPAQEWILHVIGDGGAALGNVHRRIVDMFLAGRSGLATRIVRSEPGGQSERLFRRSEMLMIPARAARRRRHHPNRLVIHALDLIGFTVLPRRDAEMLGPGIGVAFAFDADQHRRRSV